MKTLTTLEQLDAKLKECLATATTQTDLQQHFASFQMASKISQKDPFSSQYYAEQMELYRWIAGKTYDISNEAVEFDVEAAIRCPFPYAGEDLQVVGNQFIAIGSLLRRLNVPRRGRILEFGPGWGNTTLAMALSGYQVTAVDIEKRFCELIRRRAELSGVDIEVVQADFAFAETVSDPFDAVVFFECFHHCSDHMRLLRALDRALKPEGRIYFAGEPIGSAFPVPWGLRMDGEALWAIRTRGWLELGFNDRYFCDALESVGWDVVLHESGETFLANVWEARRLEGFSVTVPALDVSIGTASGRKDSLGILLEDVSNGWGFCGPFCRLPAGRWMATARLSLAHPSSGAGVVEICTGVEARIIAKREVALSNSQTIEIAFELEQPANHVQMRLYCTAPTTALIEGIELRRSSGLEGPR